MIKILIPGLTRRKALSLTIIYGIVGCIWLVEGVASLQRGAEYGSRVLSASPALYWGMVGGAFCLGVVFLLLAWGCFSTLRNQRSRAE